jgi:hypothetical protein
MKYIPILFSTPMVRAILQNRKTQTRRLRGLDKINERPDDVVRIEYVLKLDGSKETGVLFYMNTGEKIFVKCPFGEQGDVLWVREKFFNNWDGLSEDETYDEMGDRYPKYAYYASVPKISYDDSGDEVLRDDYKWKPSIHMPKEACRLFLRNNIIKCERLQSISEGDAIAEGINPYTHNGKDKGINNKAIFRDLWISIHGPESWDLNPWVWAIEFEQITKEEAEW